MYYQKLVLIVLLSTYSLFACTIETTGFDEICNIYIEATNSSLTLSKEELNNYIFDNIKTRVNSADALSVFSAGLGLDPEQRYPIFKESAEYVLKRTWNCKEMKQLMENR